MLSPLELVGYLRFCKLCKSHSKASLSTLLLLFCCLILGTSERSRFDLTLQFTERDPVHKTASRALARPYPPPILQLGVFTPLLLFKFDQKLSPLHSYAISTRSKLRLRPNSSYKRWIPLSSSSFNSKVQYEFNNSAGCNRRGLQDHLKGEP